MVVKEVFTMRASSLLLSFLLLFVLASPVHADYFVWRDSDTGLSITYPDTWKQVNNRQPDDVFSVMLPSNNANAICRVRARNDGRFKIYPPEFAGAVQQVAYNYDFWQAYLGEYDNYEIEQIHNGAGLGLGTAGYIVANYEAATPGASGKRKALAFATLYYDTAYILECSANEEAFPYFKRAFLSFAKTVNFRPVYNKDKSGYYRNFFSNPRIGYPNLDQQYLDIY